MLRERGFSVPTVALLGVGIGTVVTAAPKIGLAAAILSLLLAIILPRPRTGLYLIAGWLPFESLAGFGSDFTATKLIAVVTFVAWGAKLVRQKRTFIDLRSTQNLFLLAFAALSVASVGQALDFKIALSHLVTLFMLIALYFLIIDEIHDQKTLANIVLISIFSGTAAAIWPLVEFSTHGAQRAAGLYLDPNGSALSLVVLIPLTLVFLKNFTSNKLVLPVVLTFLVGGVFVTTSRGAIVALVVMLMMAVFERTLQTGFRQKLATLLVVLLIGTALFALLDNRFTLQTVQTTRGAGRFDIWTTGSLIFADRWVQGVGLANFKYHYARYAAHIADITPYYRKPLGAHNSFLEAAVETGLFGLISLVGFLASLLMKLRFLRNQYLIAGDLSQAAICSMFFISTIGLLVGSLALSTLYMKIFWLVLALASCHAIQQKDVLHGRNLI